MSEMTKTVQLTSGHTVSGTVNAVSPDDMAVDIAAVPAAVQNQPEFGEQLQDAVTELDRLFDAEPGFSDEPVSGSDEPTPGLTVALEGDTCLVTNESEGDWTLLGSAQLADSVIAGSVARIES